MRVGLNSNALEAACDLRGSSARSVCAIRNLGVAANQQERVTGPPTVGVCAVPAVIGAHDRISSLRAMNVENRHPRKSPGILPDQIAMAIAVTTACRPYMMSGCEAQMIIIPSAPGGDPERDRLASG
jgi:hypothetical protein